MAEWSTRVAIAKRDDEQHLVFGWAYTATDESGALLTDYDGHQIPVEELEAAAYEYVAVARGTDEMHERTGIGVLVESVILTPEKREAMGLPAGATRWWVGFRVTDPGTWERVKSGALAELSIKGQAFEEAA